MKDWHYGWDAIEEAVKRNKKRIDYSRSQAALEKDYVIVPKRDFAACPSKSSCDDDKEEAEAAFEVNSDDGEGAEKLQPSKRCAYSSKKKNILQTKSDSNADTIEEISDVDFLLSTNKRASYLRKRRRRKQDESHTNRASHGFDHVVAHQCDRSDIKKDIPKVCERGRPASSIGESIMTWDEILQSMTMEERSKLIVSAIHPPLPFEPDMKNDGKDGENQRHNTIICGALKGEFAKLAPLKLHV